MEQPTIVVRIKDNYLARSESGDIIEAELGKDGQPDWDNGTVCDERGIGGAEGYQTLCRAFAALEENASIVIDWESEEYVTVS